MPVAFGTAFIGEGVASYFGVPQPASTGLIAVLSYLGPRGTEAILCKWVSRKMAA
ncbi:phage holin family protein [Agrobacterium deltaense]|uniref:phage holin family protein n=1 Tax=Agrobacterium deltaense TaxID=1183412 RepID=UPI003FD0081D